MTIDKKEPEYMTEEEVKEILAEQKKSNFDPIRGIRYATVVHILQKEKLKRELTQEELAFVNKEFGKWYNKNPWPNRPQLSESDFAEYLKNRIDDGECKIQKFGG